MLVIGPPQSYLFLDGLEPVCVVEEGEEVGEHRLQELVARRAVRRLAQAQLVQALACFVTDTRLQHRAGDRGMDSGRVDGMRYA
jgi:hypothetical protein